MEFNFEMLIGFAFVFLVLLVLFGVIGGGIYLIHFLLTMPMRRAERARLLLDLIEMALDRGQPIEEGLVFISQRRGNVMGGPFHPLVVCLQKGMRLADAIAAVPCLLPPQVIAMLKAGQRIGDLKKVLPACRQMLKDSVSQTQGAMNYVVALAFVITPAVLFLFGFILVKVIPKMMEVCSGMEVARPAGIAFLVGYHDHILIAQTALVIFVWIAAILHVCGSRTVLWLPFLDRIYFRLPWRRKRMQRDFSVMLAILLDSGMPEPEAVTLAAECTANKMFQARAARAVEGLQRGQKLTEAVQAMDDAGEFRWRLTNACYAHGGFLKALSGWHLSLDAKAFQQEQAAAHIVTTVLVLFNGVIVGSIVVSVFMILVSIIHEGVLW